MEHGKDLPALGYKREDGGIGIRNKVLIAYTTDDAAPVARAVYRRFRAEAADVDLLGCDGPRITEQMTRKLAAFCTHPNVGAVLLVCGGCEQDGAGEIEAAVRSSGRAVAPLRAGEGAQAVIHAGVEAARELLSGLKSAERTPITLSDLVIGVECGGSDFTSGLAANPLVGDCTDYLVGRGATVLFEEMYEAIGLRDLLLSRCATEQAQAEIAETYDKFYRHAVDSGQFSISPGNIRGGLTTIEEKSMGALIKCGTAPIQGVLKLCEKPSRPGLWYVDMLTDLEAGCGFAASADAGSTLLYQTCGAHLSILTSGRGHVISNPVAPVLKITGNSQTYARMKGDFDLDAGPLITGEKQRSELLDELLALIAGVAGGAKTRGEALGHAEYFLNYENQQPLAAKREGAASRG